MQARERLEEEHCSRPDEEGEGVEERDDVHSYDGGGDGERDPRTQYHQQRSETEQRREAAGHDDHYAALCDCGPQTMTSTRMSDTDG